MALNAQQLADLMAACRPGVKVEPLSSTKSTDWIAWRDNFVIAADINHWGHQRARREIARAMQGAAKMAVRDIPIGDVAVADNFHQLLQAYEARFMPAAASDLARSEFKEARQKEQETILEWHARLRELYTRAYPNLNAAAVAASLDLRDAFILGLADPSIKADTWKARPANFNAALGEATSIRAGLMVLGGHQHGGFEIKKEMNSIGAGAGFGGKFAGQCYNCGYTGHRARDCRRAEGAGAPYPARGGGGNRGNGSSARGRGGSNQRGRGGGSSARGTPSRGGGGGRGRGGNSFRNNRWKSVPGRLNQEGDDGSAGFAEAPATDAQGYQSDPSYEAAAAGAADTQWMNDGAAGNE